MKRFQYLVKPGENTRMTLIAGFIGLAAGLASIAFRLTVDLVHEVIFVRGGALLGIVAESPRWWLLPLLPISGMILLIPLSLAFPGEVNGYGFTRFLRKVNLEGGVIRARAVLLKIVSTALTIGSGNSAGVEGPIAQIGGAIGSQVGHFFRVSGNRTKVYVAAGSAAGIAGIFNAPIAGIFFAAEIVLLGTYEISSFAALVVASALATVVSRAHYGETPAFPIPAYEMINPFVELPLYALMAFLVGLLAVGYIKVFYRMRDGFGILPLHPQLKPLLGAAIVGGIGIGFPQVMGDGYHYIARVLAGDGLLPVMLCLILLKMAATSITLGSGGAGGVFAPSLFIGAVIGGSYGAVAHALLPHATANPGAYATVGIGAFLASATHAPMTAIFLLFEMTGNYKIIIPIMLTSILGTITAKKFCRDSIDTVDFSREGIDIHEGREVAIMKSIKVGKAITEEINFISENANINHLLETFREARDSFYFPVINYQGHMVGIVSMQDVKNLLHDEQMRVCHLVGALCTREVIMLTPEHTLFDAMQLFDVKGIEEIPVVESPQEPWLLGMLRRRDVLAAYNHEVLKRGISAKAEAIRMVCFSEDRGQETENRGAK